MIHLFEGHHASRDFQSGPFSATMHSFSGILNVSESPQPPLVKTSNVTEKVAMVEENGHFWGGTGTVMHPRKSGCIIRRHPLVHIVACRLACPQKNARVLNSSSKTQFYLVNLSRISPSTASTWLIFRKSGKPIFNWNSWIKSPSLDRRHNIDKWPCCDSSLKS